MCQALYQLPGPGGLMNQDCFLIEGMDMVVEAQGVKRELDDKQSEAEQERSKKLGLPAMS